MRPVRHTLGLVKLASAKETDMTVISNSVEIRCSPEEAFDYLSDHRSELEWNPGIESIDKLTDGPVGLRTKYRRRGVSQRREGSPIGYDQ
jgi:hypothetical protein